VPKSSMTSLTPRAVSSSSVETVAGASLMAVLSRCRHVGSRSVSFRILETISVRSGSLNYFAERFT
jgi:hypothetical protein